MPGPLRILIGTDTFAPDVNGSSNFSKRLAAGLVERGHDVHVMAPAQGRSGVFTEVYDGAAMTVHRINSWRWYPHPWLRFMLPWRIKANAEKVVRRVRPDVIHFQSHIVVGRGLVTSAKRHGIRLVGTNHTMPENVLQHATIIPRPILRRLVRSQWDSARRWFSQADEVTAPSQRAADYFERNTGMTGVLAISCGIDTRAYSPAFEPRTENRVVFVGRLDEEKHIHELLEAVARLHADLDARVSIVGDGEMRHRLEIRAGELGIENRVTFHGFATDEELRRVLSSSTVFAMPSRAELQSIATLEALSTALPVVAADAMALPHLVQPGENGYLYPPGDIDAFARCLDTILRADADELTRLKKGALEMVRSHDITRTLDIFEALYRGEPAPHRTADSETASH